LPNPWLASATVGGIGTTPVEAVEHREDRQAGQMEAGGRLQPQGKSRSLEYQKQQHAPILAVGQPAGCGGSAAAPIVIAGEGGS